MKQRIQGIIIGVVLTTLLLGGVTALAATTRTIEANFGNYRMYHFANRLTVVDTDGEVLQPFSYNGNLYLPAQAVLRAMGVNASWDETTGIFRFGQVATPPPTRERTPLQMAAPFFDTGVIGSLPARTSVVRRDAVNMGGVRYQNAIVYRSRDQEILSGANTLFTLHNLRGGYQLLTGYIGRIDGSGMLNTTVNIYGDGELIQTHRIIATDMPTPISVPVAGVTQLRVEFSFSRASNPRTEYALIGYLE